jgi:hypothetical protein
LEYSFSLLRYISMATALRSRSRTCCGVASSGYRYGDRKRYVSSGFFLAAAAAAAMRALRTLARSFSLGSVFQSRAGAATPTVPTLQARRGQRVDFVDLGFGIEGTEGWRGLTRR